MTATTIGAISVVVVGNGMIGAATTRYLAMSGVDVVTIGAPSRGPNIRTLGEGTGSVRPPDHAVWSSHNDAGRLTRLQDRDAAWAAATRAAVERYREIEALSGIDFFHDVGALIVSRPGGDGVSPDPSVVMEETGVAHERWEPGEDGWRDRWPDIDLPASHYVVHEPSPAGWIDPKRMIEAQNVVAARAGATILTDTVTAVEPDAQAWRVHTASGAEHRADRVVVAAGAFTNVHQLLPSAAPLTLKSEVIVLGEVDARTAQRLASFPTVKYFNDGEDLHAIYMTPPIRYDDGRWYIKLGANTPGDRELRGLADLREWFLTDTDPEWLPVYQLALEALWPDVEFLRFRTQPCVITYSDARHPIIEEVASGLIVATAGNGGGAKGSDEWGRRAAALVLGGSDAD